MHARANPPARPATRAFVVATVFLFSVAGLAAAGRLPLLVPWFYLGASLLSIAVYALDKSAAVAGRRRTPENTLHLLALVGGWPGALFAQQWLRHKSRKTSFRVVFWLTVVLNIVALGWLASGRADAVPDGLAFLLPA